MKSFWTYVIILTILSTVAKFILPKIKIFKSWLINFLVKKAEKKIQGSKLGQQKKDWVLQKLDWWGIKLDEVTDALINSAVEVMNSKNSSVSSDFQQTMSDKFSNGIGQGIDKVNSTFKTKFIKK